MQRSYVLAPNTLRRIMRAVFWRFQLIVIISFLGFGLFLARSGRAIHWALVLPMVGVIALVYFLVIFLYYRQQIKLLYSIRYEVDGNGIIYRQIGQPSMRIGRADIAAIREGKDGIQIETVTPGVNLQIPRGLAQSGDRDLREILNAWSVIQPAEHNQNNPWLGLIFTGAAVALLIVFLTNNLWVTMPLVLFLVGFAIYSNRWMLKIPSSKPGMARMYSFAISFLVFMAIMKSLLLAMSLFLVR